jgi:hypothetical protein
MKAYVSVRALEISEEVIGLDAFATHIEEPSEICGINRDI